jgi:hypothetical protein
LSTAQSFAVSNRATILPRLLMCEGHKDRLFFAQFIEHHGLPRFHIHDTAGPKSSKGGITKFAMALRAFRGEHTKVWNNLKDVLLVADNDETPEENFAQLCAQIEQVFGAGKAPTKALEAVAVQHLRITVMMIPWAGERGHLERLCVDAARAADQRIGRNVDAFLDLIGADRWNNDSRYGKAWLRTNLAARCERDPFVPLGRVFDEPANQSLIPLGHPSFDKIKTVLAKFA